MTFLVMETSGAIAVLALGEAGGAVRAVSLFEGRRTLSRRLFGELDSFLCNNGLALKDLEAICVGIGPGSFTGVRVGVTTCKTLAQAAGKPLIGLGTLEAYAVAASLGNPELTVVPALPSRRGEAYTAIYRNGRFLREPFAAQVAEMPALLASLQFEGAVLLCGETSLLERCPCLRLDQPWPPPEGLVRLAAARLSEKRFDDPLALVPLYVVPPSISTPKDPRVLPVA